MPHILMNGFTKRLIVAVINGNINNHRSNQTKALRKDRGNILGTVDPQPCCTERFCKFHNVRASKFYAEGAAILELLLYFYHIIAPVPPHEMNKITLFPYRCLKFHRRKQESTVP